VSTGVDAAGSVDESQVVGTRVERFARDRRRWYRRPVLVILAVTALAGGLRFYHLSAPHAYVFDETYYAKDGCLDAGFPFQQCHLETPTEQTFTVHPPLGRWIIAGGEAAFGNRPFGWRFASAVAGTLSVLLLSILAFRLFGSVLWAGVSGLLLATEGLNFVQSRVSMLDILLTFFVVAAFLCVVLDREWIERRTPPPERLEPGSEAALMGMPPDRPPSPIFRPWRVLAGIAFGAALATKWSGGPALVGGIVLIYGWERGRRKRFGLRRPVWEAIRDESFAVFVFLVILPLAVYVATYARWFADNGVHFDAWFQVQKGMYEYSAHLRATHPYASRPWTWPFLVRPVAYYYKGGNNPTTSAEILGLGNPVVFWTCLVAIPYTFVMGMVRRDWRAGLILAAYAFQYFQWFLAARTSFLFYMTPITPFMVLALVYGLRDMSDVRIGERRTRPLAPLAGLVVLASVVVFAYFFPVLTGRILPYAEWHKHMWFPRWI